MIYKVINIVWCFFVTNKNKIFKNAGKKHDGKTYDEICQTYPQYIAYLSSNGHKKRYRALVDYFVL